MAMTVAQLKKILHNADIKTYKNKNKRTKASYVKRSDMKKIEKILADTADDMFSQYIGSMLWSSTDDNEDPLDENYSEDDLSEEAKATAKKDLEDFVKKAGDLIADLDDTDVAHDFWLTRNGHGAGFWDREYTDDVDPKGTLGEELSEIAKSFGEQNPYVGDDGLIYIG
jgi:hypothetical protein